MNKDICTSRIIDFSVWHKVFQTLNNRQSECIETESIREKRLKNDEVPSLMCLKYINR